MTGPELDQFIASNIHTVEEVEILALLSRSPETFWSADAMAQHLSLRPEVAAARSRDLDRRGLLRTGESGPVYRFAPANDRIRKQVLELVEAYRDRRISVINSIYSANLTRLRSFADAFKLGGGQE
ncbi:MAG TPA: hypothetical protein VNA04_17305 [Thermoanaerobaculia bacterium]|nr:hypothetical protein [Thermoanaerobaculia bacterium]